MTLPTDMQGRGMTDAQGRGMTDAQGRDMTAAPRAVLRESVRLLYRVLGEKRLGTASGNAWEAVLEDRKRARDRAEIDRMLADARASR
jgi:hypothetical protein